MPFLYPLLNYLQPGELWTALIPFKPMLLAAMLAGVLALRRGVKPDGPLLQAYYSRPVLLWLGVFVMVQVISVYYGGGQVMVHELQFWEVYPIFVAISVLSLRDAAALRRYIWGTMIGSSFVIFYGIWAVITHAPIAVENRAAVAYGLYDNPNDYSFIIIMVLPFAYLYLRICQRRWQRLALVTILIGCIVGIFLSLSRGGMLALVLEITLLIWITTKAKQRFLALAIMAVLGTVASVHQFRARQVADAGTGYTAQASADTRFELWHAALACFKAHPILGVGSRRFRELATEYASVSHDERGKVAHNTYLEVAADTGTLGFGSFVLILAAMWRSFRGARLADALGDGVIEAQVAGWVAFWSILFRACFDAKETDWSFYFLIVVAVATAGLARRSGKIASGVAPSAVPTAGIAIPARPAVYGQR